MPFLEQSQGTAISGGNFHDASVNYITNNYTGNSREGIKLLLKFSIPEAIHNSNARDPPKCHPGTREDYIRNIANWRAGGWKRRPTRAWWMRGPAGVGKSAIAQSYAEKIEATGKLGATFFFHRLNDWNDPDKFIPTIVYQLTTRYPAYRDLIDSIILRDPLVLQTTIAVQFRELLEKPLTELSAKGQSMGTDAIIIVDGLDECKTVAAQGAIIELVTTSIDRQTTPFLWAFFSRPEPNITSAFSTELALKVSRQLNLPVSRDADHDIEKYLRDSFGAISTKYGIRFAWPFEEDIHWLVDQSFGLFVYPATIIRYIDQDTGASGPEERLQSAMELRWETAEVDVNPFAALDRLYVLIMDQIPKDILPNTLSLLFIRFNYTATLVYHCSILGLSSSTFHTVTRHLHSVLRIFKSEDGVPKGLLPYHKSFVEFLSTSTRSGPEYCINGPNILSRCFDASVKFLRHTPVITDISILAWHDPTARADGIHWFALHILFSIAPRQEVDLRKDTLQEFAKINWNQLSTLGVSSFEFPNIETFIAKVSRYWRHKVIRSFGARDIARRTFSNIKQGQFRIGWKPLSGRDIYVIGSESKKALLVCNKPKPAQPQLTQSDSKEDSLVPLSEVYYKLYPYSWAI